MLKVLRSSQITTVFSPYPGVNEVKVCKGGVYKTGCTHTHSLVHLNSQKLADTVLCSPVKSSHPLTASEHNIQNRFGILLLTKMAVSCRVKCSDSVLVR